MNDTLIIIAGMSRGGTNLLWNIVQSHPAVIDSYYELNEIFGRKTSIGLFEKIRIELEALWGIPTPSVCGLVKERLSQFAQKSLREDRFNCEKFPGVYYDPAESESLTVCTKLVSAWETDPLRKLFKRNDALKYIPLLERAFSKVKVVFLIRNGLAVAEGWGRRGAAIRTAAWWYGFYVAHYEEYVRKNPDRSMIVRFEDLLTDPFSTAEHIWHRLKLPEIPLAHLRIAIKPTVRTNHNVVNTTEKNKIWINRENWRDYMDVGINEAQLSKISQKDQELFVNMNRGIMARYSYI